MGECEVYIVKHYRVSRSGKVLYKCSPITILERLIIASLAKIDHRGKLPTVYFLFPSIPIQTCWPGNILFFHFFVVVSVPTYLRCANCLKEAIKYPVVVSIC